MKEKALITGMGCISGAGINLEETMKHIYAGIRPPVGAPQRFSCKLDRQYPVFEVKGNENLATNLSFYFAEKASMEALADAGLDEGKLPDARVGVFLGSTAGCFFNKEDYYRDIRANKSADRAYLAEVLLNSSTAHQIARKFGLKGPALTISNACASGTDAIGIASKMIENGTCDIAIAGGADEIVRMVYLGFISLMNTSGSPCAPFSKSRSGLNLGEGAGICVLESASSAEKRGAVSLGSIAGYSSVSDSYHVTAPEPSGRGLKSAFREALEQAGIEPGDVSFISAHGTGTIENDRVEGCVISDIFGRDIPVAATKAYTGHSLGAAGAIQAVLCARSLLDKKISGAPDYTDFDPDCGITLHAGNREISGRYACSSSLAFGGINSVLVIEGFL
ncbi:MAG: beta-ketoacyl-[acyl-carrier-protein] synthase family protein [Brevinematales bacterium]